MGELCAARRREPPVQVSTYADKIVYAVIGPDDAIYGISRNGALNGKIVKLKLRLTRRADLAKAPVIVPESDVAIVSGGAEQGQPDLSLSPTRLFVRDIVGGPNQVRVFDLDGKPQGNLPLPDVAANTGNRTARGRRCAVQCAHLFAAGLLRALESRDRQGRRDRAQESHRRSRSTMPSSRASSRFPRTAPKFPSTSS